MPGLHTAHEAQVESDYRNPYEDDDEMEGLPAYDPRGVIERLAELHPYEGDEMDDSEDERVEVPNGRPVWSRPLADYNLNLPWLASYPGPHDRVATQDGEAGQGPEADEEAGQPEPQHLNQPAVERTDLTDGQIAPLPALPPLFPLREKSAARVHEAINHHHLHLTIDQLDALHNSPYDNLWMLNHDIHPLVLRSFTSKHKLERLSRGGALKEGDVLAVHVPDNRLVFPFMRFAEVIATPWQGSSRPYFRIGYKDVDGRLHTDYLNDCSGHSEVIEKYNSFLPMYPIQAGSPWTTLHVLRGMMHLGTLHDVRQAFAYYDMLLDGYYGVTDGRSNVLRRPRANR